MSEQERDTWAAKVKLWCVLNGVDNFNRMMRNEEHILVNCYAEKGACTRCREMNNESCAAMHRSVLVMNMATHDLYKENQMDKVEKDWKKYIWCVEWVKYV